MVSSMVVMTAAAAGKPISFGIPQWITRNACTSVPHVPRRCVVPRMRAGILPTIFFCVQHRKAAKYPTAGPSCWIALGRRFRGLQGIQPLLSGAHVAERGQMSLFSSNLRKPG